MGPQAGSTHPGPLFWSQVVHANIVDPRHQRSLERPQRNYPSFLLTTMETATEGLRNLPKVPQ